MKTAYLRCKYLLPVFILILNISNLLAAPVITSFSPSSGPVGTTVIISGSGFNNTAENNIVFFGAARANVIACNNSLIAVTVPYGATFNEISVTDVPSGLTCYSDKPFLSTFNCGGKIESTSFIADLYFPDIVNSQWDDVCDLDNDGKPDLVVTDYYANKVSIYRNTSTTDAVSFSPRTDYVTGINPASIAISDLNGDGKPDIAVINRNSNTISLYKNNSTPGNIAFTTLGEIPTSVKPYHIIIDDFNSDGKPDIAVASAGEMTGVVSVHMNISVPGSISFAPRVDFVAGIGTGFIASGDLDGDGKPDIAVTNLTSNTVSVFRNNCTNGIIDAASFNTRADISTSENPYCVAIADFDNDGKPDLAVAKAPQNAAISIYKNISTPGSLSAGSFAPKVDFACGACPLNVSVNDVDGDGKPDIVFSFYEFNKIGLFKNQSVPGVINSNSFGAKVEIPVNSIISNIAICDLNQDERPDLILSNTTDGAISVLKNQVMTCPTITAIAPESAGEGETVTITGTNLAEITSVSFGGISAASFNIISSTSIKAVVGSGATGDVVVSGFYGTATFPGFKFRDIQSITLILLPIRLTEIRILIPELLPQADLRLCTQPAMQPLQQ